MILPNDDKVSEFSQDEYRKMVWKYFKDYNVKLPFKMLMHYTPYTEIQETSRYRIEYERKLPTGIWIESGVLVSGKLYFIGDDICGYAIDSNVMRMSLSMGQSNPEEKDNVKYTMLPKRLAIEYAVVITYFHRILVPVGARIAPGPG